MNRSVAKCSVLRWVQVFREALEDGGQEARGGEGPRLLRSSGAPALTTTCALLLSLRRVGSSSRSDQQAKSAAADAERAKRRKEQEAKDAKEWAAAQAKKAELEKEKAEAKIQEVATGARAPETH